MKIEHTAIINENGRIVIPLSLREYLQVGAGDKLRNIQEIVKRKNKNNISLVSSLKESRAVDFHDE